MQNDRHPVTNWGTTGTVPQLDIARPQDRRAKSGRGSSTDRLVGNHFPWSGRLSLTRHPQAVREGLARRDLIATTGQCPCGGRLEASPWGSSPVAHPMVRHRADCPGATANLVAAMEAGGWSLTIDATALAAGWGQ